MWKGAVLSAACFFLAACAEDKEQKRKPRNSPRPPRRRQGRSRSKTMPDAKATGGPARRLILIAARL